MTEMAVLLTGQATVHAQHTRQVEAASTFTKTYKDAQVLVRKHGKLCKGPELFRPKFNAHVEQERGQKREGLLALKQQTKPTQRKPFHEGPSRGRPSRGRPNRGGFNPTPSQGQSSFRGSSWGTTGGSFRGQTRGNSSQSRYVPFCYEPVSKPRNKHGSKCVDRKSSTGQAEKMQNRHSTSTGQTKSKCSSVCTSIGQTVDRKIT